MSYLMILVEKAIGHPVANDESGLIKKGPSKTVLGHKKG